MVLDPMTANYNLTKFVNSSSLGQLFVNSNTLLGGYYIGYLFLVCIWVVATISIKKTGYSIKNAITGSTFLTTLVALLLRAAGMLGNWETWAVIVIFIVVFFINTLTKEG